MYFNKKHGLMIKTLGLDEKGKVNSTVLVTDLKLGATVAADRFVFKAPEGVQVQDLSKMGRP